MYLPTDGDCKINSKNAGFAKLEQQRSLVPRLNGAFTMCQVASQNMHGGVGEGACFVLLFFLAYYMKELTVLAGSRT